MGQLFSTTKRAAAECPRSPRIAARWGAGLLAGFAAAGLFGGCASLSAPALPCRNVNLAEQVGGYKSAEISYRVDAGQLSLPMSVARIEGRRVSFDEIVSRPQAGSASGRLSIQYPHPDGRPDVALARVEIQNDPRPPVAYWKPSTWRRGGSETSDDAVCHESWRLDMGKADLDALIEQLRRDGCLTDEHPHAKGSELTIGFDGRRVTKPWGQSPALEAAMQRVRSRGNCSPCVDPRPRPARHP